MTRGWMALLALSCLAGRIEAKVICDSKRAAAVDIPDSWDFDPKQGTWRNRDGSGKLVFLASAASLDLDRWSQVVAGQNKDTRVFPDRLGGLPARRLEFVSTKGDTTVMWLARKGDRGSILFLNHSKGCEDDIPAIRRKLSESYRWLK